MASGAKSLKVGLVVDDGLDSTDGVQQYVLTLGKWLQSNGHEVRYLAGQTKRQDLPGLYSLARNIKVRFNGNSLSIPLPAGRRKIRRVLKEERFDVLHIQTPHSPFMAQKVVLAAEPGTAILGTFHILPYGWMSAFGNRLLGIWLRPSLKRFDEIVSVSSAAAGFAKRSFKIDTPVVPNAVDLSHFRGAEPLPQYGDQVTTILFLGRLVPRKGCFLLLQAVLKLRDQGLTDFRVVICGRGPEEAKLRQFISQNGLQEQVKLAGFVSEEDKPRYYASADIAVFPSQGGESFGIVLIEAMASGRSVVLAADNAGYHSVMAAQPELLFPVGETDVLAEKLTHYLKDNEARKQARKRSSIAVEQYDINRVGKQLLTRYYQALRKKRGA